MHLYKKIRCIVNNSVQNDVCNWKKYKGSRLIDGLSGLCVMEKTKYLKIYKAQFDKRCWNIWAHHLNSLGPYVPAVPQNNNIVYHKYLID